MHYSGNIPSLLLALLAFAPLSWGQQQQPQTPCTAQAERRVQADIRSAFQLRNTNDNQKALNLLLSDREAALPSCPCHEALFTQIAVTEFRMGDMISAEQTLNGTLRSNVERRQIESTDTALAHFLLGGIYSVRGEYSAAESEYRNALRIVLAFGHSELISVAQIDGDLALLYLREGKMRASEEALQNSIAAEKQCGRVPSEESILRRDTLLHVQFQRGRISQALTLSEQLMRTYGNNLAIPRSLRAHLFRDRGELSISAQRPDEAVMYLNKSLGLTDSSFRTPEYATILTILAFAYRQQNKMPEASASLDQAVKRAEVFQIGFPQSAAIVFGAYGSIMNLQKKWGEARPMLVKAAKLAENDPRMETTALENLIAADHHLHQKQEESSSRKKLKSLQQNATEDPNRKNTVDVLAFATTPAR